VERLGVGVEARDEVAQLVLQTFDEVVGPAAALLLVSFVNIVVGIEPRAWNYRRYRGVMMSLQ